jgi:hypothetical protein
MIASGPAELNSKKATGYEGEDPGRLHDTKLMGIPREGRGSVKRRQGS